MYGVLRHLSHLTTHKSVHGSSTAVHKYAAGPMELILFCAGAALPCVLPPLQLPCSLCALVCWVAGTAAGQHSWLGLRAGCSPPQDLPLLQPLLLHHMLQQQAQAQPHPAAPRRSSDSSRRASLPAALLAHRQLWVQQPGWVSVQRGLLLSNRCVVWGSSFCRAIWTRWAA